MNLLNNIKYLTKRHIDIIVRKVEKQFKIKIELVHKNLLDSAINAPKATFFGESLLKDPIEIASAYMYYISKDHAFDNANKRIGVLAMLSFLEMNNLYFHFKDENLIDWSLKAVNNEITREELAILIKNAIKNQNHIK